jgi:hypothetical protein
MKKCDINTLEKLLVGVETLRGDMNNHGQSVENSLLAAKKNLTDALHAVKQLYAIDRENDYDSRMRMVLENCRPEDNAMNQHRGETAGAV